MAKQKEAGAGRGFLNPKPVGMADEDYVTPEQDYEMRKARAARKTQEQTDKAYKEASGMKKGGYVKAADGCAQRGKTRGKMV